MVIRYATECNDVSQPLNFEPTPEANFRLCETEDESDALHAARFEELREKHAREVRALGLPEGTMMLGPSLIAGGLTPAERQEFENLKLMVCVRQEIHRLEATAPPSQSRLRRPAPQSRTRARRRAPRRAIVRTIAKPSGGGDDGPPGPEPDPPSPCDAPLSGGVS